jgi:hypothetical protein
MLSFYFSDGWLIDLQIDLDAFNGERALSREIRRIRASTGSSELTRANGRETPGNGRENERTRGSGREREGNARDNDWTRGNAIKTRLEGSK